MVRALLFDFDGLLVDSETPAFTAWQETYRELGTELDLELWAQAIGTIDGFDPITHLSETVGEFDREDVDERRRTRELALAHSQPFLPGVLDYLERAKELDIHVAIVSSASHRWINEHLERLETADGWATIVAANGDVNRAKPLPVLYLEALETLGVEPGEAIAFEDSPNGVTAAKAAGLFCVAVPNSVTVRLDVSHADLVVESLAALPLDDLLARVG